MCQKEKNADNEVFKNIVDIGVITCDEIIKCFWEDMPYIIKVGEKLIKLPHLISQEVFWGKFKKFAMGIKSDPTFEAKFATKIANTENRDDFAKRIIAILDKIEEEQKVDYIINATRAFCWDQIDRIVYFRICRAVEKTYIEDLLFLKNNYAPDRLFPENITVEELTAVGIMRLSVLDDGTLNPDYVPETHSFTDFGKLVFDKALNYERLDLLQ